MMPLQFPKEMKESMLLKEFDTFGIVFKKLHALRLKSTRHRCSGRMENTQFHLVRVTRVSKIGKRSN